MIKVSVFYPQQPDAKFDMTYYCDHHTPWSAVSSAPQ
jgi:hypothetical protein